MNKNQNSSEIITNRRLPSSFQNLVGSGGGGRLLRVLSGKYIALVGKNLPPAVGRMVFSGCGKRSPVVK